MSHEKISKYVKWTEDLVVNLDHINHEFENNGYTWDKGKQEARWTIPMNHPIHGDKGIPSQHEGSCSNANKAALLERFLRVKDRCSAILEIGICQVGFETSTTKMIFDNKLPETIYIGIDINDKSELNDPSKNIHMIQADSGDIDGNWAKMQALGVTKLDFIFIDGWHTLNQVKKEWEYTRYMSDYCIVGMHDTTTHPGPKEFIAALDKDKWHVEENLCPEDWGIGFAWKK